MEYKQLKDPSVAGQGPKIRKSGPGLQNSNSARTPKFKFRSTGHADLFSVLNWLYPRF